MTKDGEERLIAWHNTLLKDEAGRNIATLSSGEDITEHRRMQEELRRSEEKYRILIDNTQDGFFIVQDGKVRFLNETLAKMIGCTVEEVIGRDFLEVIAPEDRSVVADRYRRKQVGEDTPKEYEFHLLHKDGRTRILVNMNVGIIQYLGEVASMGTVKDITEKKRLEAQLLQVQRLESIGTLAAGIAHDINNLLSPITLSLYLLKAKLVDAENQEMLDILEKSVERAANMVKQVQSFARGAESKRTNLQIAHLISEIEQIAKETFPRNIEVRTDVSDDLWTASGDDTHLHQVLMNLCVNARDAMTKGGILSMSAENIFIDKSLIRMHVEAKIGPYVVITVSDTGTGIPPEIMNGMFEPFFTTKQLGKGTGLGLSTALGIMKSHGGFINVYSEVGKGSAFKVYLPTAHASEAQTVDERLELPVGQGELILVVEDEAMICKITKSVLETHGYKVLTASDGTEAVPLYEKRKDEVEAVIMDMMLPIMDGPQCIEALRKIKPNVKIIAVSGLDKSDSLTKGATAAQAFLTKPYTADILLKTVQKVMAAK